MLCEALRADSGRPSFEQLFEIAVPTGVIRGGVDPDLALAAKAFVPVWLVVGLVNMWVGVTKAGYSARDELPILAIVFIMPAALAAGVVWRTAR